MWPVLVLTAMAASPEPISLERTTGNKFIARTPNFEVRISGDGNPVEIGQVCEAWRDHLRQRWLGKRGGDAWNPPCLVVVHSRREAYAAAVGRAAGPSFGSTWIDVKEGNVTGRRVDLLADPSGRLSALGHELTHVVIADAFGGKQPPPWANEGMALLADSADKQAAHARDAAAAQRGRSAFRSAELLALEGYPNAERIPAFYGQSAALVALLTKRARPSQFVLFLQRAEAEGYDRALREIYGIDGASELERLMHRGA